MIDQIAIFEDALGEHHNIDLMFINNWSAFRESLERDFRGTPGSRRIFSMKYRLSDRLRVDCFVDPRHPPPFTSIFQQGRHVQMSMHFEWDEVSDEQCPRCGFTQEGKEPTAAETVCTRCRFSYRTLVESQRIQEIDDDNETLPPQDARYGQWAARPDTEQRDHDEPSYFSRITISKKPMHTCGRCSESYSRLYDLNRHNCRHRNDLDRYHSVAWAALQRVAEADDHTYWKRNVPSRLLDSLPLPPKIEPDSPALRESSHTCGICFEVYSHSDDYIHHCPYYFRRVAESVRSSGDYTQVHPRSPPILFRDYSATNAPDTFAVDYPFPTSDESPPSTPYEISKRPDSRPFGRGEERQYVYDELNRCWNESR